ncbi:hypothetical protein T484DRAFT_1762004, partial [Baffinella frigidus]
FLHPANRRELTRAECVALDEHTLRNGLGHADVTTCFDSREDILAERATDEQRRQEARMEEEASLDVSTEWSRRQVARMQGEAQAILNSLYSGQYGWSWGNTSYGGGAPATAGGVPRMQGGAAVGAGALEDVRARSAQTSCHQILGVAVGGVAPGGGEEEGGWEHRGNTPKLLARASQTSPHWPP